MNKPVRIGLTGGIGSGKTTVAKAFEKLGVPVFYSDDCAREAYYDPALKTEIVRLLGPRVYTPEGSTDKVWLRQRLFGDAEALAALEALIHPYVRQQFAAFCQARTNAVYVLNESAILFEKGLDAHMDHILLVSAGIEERIKRVMNRDGLSRKDVEKRMALQLGEEARIIRSDTILVNDDAEAVTEKVFNIHKIFMGKIWGN